MRKRIFQLAINTGDYQSFIDRIIEMSLTGISHYVCMANVHMLVEGYKDRKFANAINKADIVAPDGVPLTWAMRLLYGIRQDRIAGMDLLPDLLHACAAKNIPIFFYGSTDSMLQKAAKALTAKFPGLIIAGSYSPPFREPTDTDKEEAIQKIEFSEAKIVFVVLGCPKQEKWMASMQGKIGATMIGIGGALPVLLGTQARAPHWMQKSGLEWLYRLQQEPFRLFKRYFVTNSLFSYLLVKEYFRIKFFRKPVS